MDLREQLLDYLKAHNVVTLATVGDDGRPWASAVFYVNDGFTLYFLSAPTTRHSVNLAAHPGVAAAVHEDYAEWKRIKGIQLEGTVARLEAGESVRAAALYARKFAFTDPSRAAGAIASALAKIAWYKLVPEALYFIDNSQGLGHRERLDLPPL